MPVQLKRIGGKPVGPAARAEEEAAEEIGPSVVELREMALAQHRELRARTIADLLRLGKGLRIVTERTKMAMPGKPCTAYLSIIA